jgi:nitrogen fixation NifU-like protein
VTAEALYHEAIVGLARAATGAGHLGSPDGSATLDNPLCGDRVTVEVCLRDGRVAALAQRVRGCLLCEAAASLLGRAAVGRTAREIDEARAALAALLCAGETGEPSPDGAWEELAAFAPVRGVPSRHTCVLLPFDALRESLARAKTAGATGPDGVTPHVTPGAGPDRSD